MKPTAKLTSVLVPVSTRDKLKRHCVKFGLKLQTEANKGLLYYLEAKKEDRDAAN